MKNQKRVAAIHDISGIGKCSLTVALPILSAAGIECAAMPTAILSTHTGGFENYTYRDLTSDMMRMADHWASYDFSFDAIYSGFLGSNEQVDIVKKIIKKLSNENTLVIVDPAMADFGRLYKTFKPDFPQKMLTLAAKADILTPNITEACLLTGVEYKDGPYTKEYIENLLLECAKIGAKQIVLTGVYFSDTTLGAATYNSEDESIKFIMTEKQAGLFHGTGDVFASVLVSAIMNGFTLDEAVKIAADFVNLSIKATCNMTNPIKYGVCFETVLPDLIRMLDKKQ